MSRHGIRAQRRRAEVLRQLHEADQLLTLVNVWDVASARVVAQTPRCTAIATASAAIAAAHGYDDGEQMPRELVIAALERICQAVDLPVTADLERGYRDVRRTVGAALDAGVVGINLEDAMAGTATMAQRVTEAVDTGRDRGIPVVVNARTDVYLLRSHWSPQHRLAAAAERGQHYLDAGADCVFVPGCIDPEHIKALSAQFGPRRLNLLAVPGLPDPHDLQQWGVARVSHGPYPHQHALAALGAYTLDHQ